MTKHTPTPWTTRKLPDYILIDGLTADGEIVNIARIADDPGTPSAAANVQHIVVAANNHNEMLEIIKLQGQGALGLGVRIKALIAKIEKV